MREFMDEDFLLESDTAKWLYTSFAKDMPIVDFHNHLSAQEIYENKNYDNISQVWLGHDHYKWRAMRSNAIAEEYITGDASDYDKYMKWCETMPRLIGSPLYHWNHLEMKRYFGYDKPLTSSTAQEFWDMANELLRQPDYSPRELLVKMKVVDMCTTDDPIDDLKYHKLLRDEESRFTVRPTFRPDKALNIGREDYLDYIKELGEKSGIEITRYSHLCEALITRMDYFAEVGCNLSDHSLENKVYLSVTELSDRNREYKKPHSSEPILALDAANIILGKVLDGEVISQAEINFFKGELLVFLGEEYHRRGWTMQLHIGAMRNNSTRRYNKIGVDAGFDSVDDINYARELSALLDTLDSYGQLPKSIIYNLNGRDTAMLGTMIGNFQDVEARSKVQLGAAWWFLDHKRGMETQLSTFAESGVLGNFVGMVTDSRSMLSYPRHEYFRRILCNYLGGLVERGEYPRDEVALKEIVEGICYNNIRDYLKEN